MTNKITIKSALAGALIGAAVVFSIGAVSGTSPTLWEYKLVHAQKSFSTLENRINSSGRDGWEAVGIGDSAGDHWILMKRAVK